MPESEWFFKKHIIGEPIIQSINAEFFKTDHINSLPSAFIRESIQNSLDAKSKESETTKVRIHIGGISINHFNTQYLKGLSEHIRADGSEIPDSAKSDLRKNIRYIVYEDFNTTGLCGDVEYADNIMPKEQNDFYFFFRNDGRSGKTLGKTLGKWGVGKTIFPAISHLHMFWALTIREDDNDEYLMGRCILGNHAIGKTGYIPWGYYGKRDNTNSILVVPEDDRSVMEDFKNYFQLKRDSEPGLSIVIPYLVDEFDYGSLIYSCLDQYLYPIAKGDLEISISELKYNSIEISSINLSTIIESQIANGDKGYVKLKYMLSFIEYINNLPREDYILLNKPSLNSAPIWSKGLLFDEETLKDAQDKFDRGENLNFIIPVQIQYMNEEKAWGSFKLHLERDEKLDSSEDIFIRDGLKIPGISSISGKKLRGVFIADQEPLTELLSFAENPAHTEWQPDAEGFKTKYKNHDKVLSFIKNCFYRITNILTKPLDDVDVDLLAEWFPFDISQSSTKKSTRRKKRKGKRSEKATPPVSKYIPPVNISKAAGGFRIIKNSAYLEEISAIEIMASYHTARGNPLKRYDPLDFSFDDDTISFMEQGVRVLEKYQNKSIYEIISQEFEVGVSGFDENRDIYVKVTKVPL